jgi:hypothetical protein
MTIDNYRFYLQNRLIQTGQTGGQLYSNTSPFSVPWIGYLRSFAYSLVRWYASGLASYDVPGDVIFPN